MSLAGRLPGLPQVKAEPNQEGTATGDHVRLQLRCRQRERSAPLAPARLGRRCASGELTSRAANAWVRKRSSRSSVVKEALAAASTPAVPDSGSAAGLLTALAGLCELPILMVLGAKTGREEAATDATAVQMFADVPAVAGVQRQPATGPGSDWRPSANCTALSTCNAVVS